MVGSASEAIGSEADVARGGRTRLPSIKPPHPEKPCTTYSAAVALAPQLDGKSAGELISELVRYGLQGVIELEVAAV